MLHNEPPRTIDERMQAVHECILAERGNQSQAETTEHVEWRTFVKWNDAPFTPQRREVRAS